MNREPSRKIMINKNLKIAIISLILNFIAGFIYNKIYFFSQAYKFSQYYKINNLFVSVLIFDTCNIILQLILAKIYSNNVIEFVGMKFRKKSLKQLLVGIVIGMLIGIIGFLVLRSKKFIEFKGISNICYTNIIISFFVAFIVGIVEEINFRGIILNQLMQFKGEVFAIIISSILFGLVHIQYYGNPIMLCSTFIFAATVGGLYVITKSLYLSIGLHFAIDFSFFLINEIFILNKTVSSMKLYSCLGCIEIATLLPILIFIIIIRRKHYAAKSLHTPKQVKKNQSLD